MISMTGYGKGEYSAEGLELTVEVRSVNNRYLDLAIKSPRAFLSAEERIRKAVRERVARGHVDVFVNYTDRRENGRQLSVDLTAAHAFMAAAQTLRTEFPSVHDDVSLSLLLRQPDIVKAEESGGSDETLNSALDSALDMALTALVAMRAAEGERLKKDLVARVGTIASLRDEIASRAPFVTEEYAKKIAARVAEYVEGKVEETRLLTEVALFADKCNIDEELTRLSSHIKEFYAIAESGEPVGRKLDFLIQEFNRECNTICSKSNDKEVTARALEMKNEIEKVREQVQNLE